MDQNKLPNGWLSSEEGLMKQFTFPSFNEAFAFIEAMVVVAERLDHHPNIYWEFCHVKLICKSHDVNKITRRDFALAESINGIL